MTAHGESPWKDAGKAYVIAEVGSNHDGDKARALELVARCAEAGADAVKFQVFRASGLVVRTHPAYAVLERLSVPLDWLEDLAAACRAAAVDFCATPFDLAAVDALAAVSPACLKVASSDLTFVSLLRRCAATGLPLAVSTGMSTFDEVDAALAVLRRHGGGDVALLHCVSMYPPDYEDMNLRVLPAMAARFGCPVGLSDHTPGSAMAVAGVALGARVIEKHVTDDRSRPGPDHGYALEFPEFAAMVRDVHHTIQALGNGIKEPRHDEALIRGKARRGLYAARDIAAGERLDAANIVALRPPTGLDAEHIDLVIDARIDHDLAAGQPLPLTLLPQRQS